jgi:hypothetical protein
MDSSGKIHPFLRGDERDERAHQRLEKALGPVIPIHDDEIEGVKAMSDDQRRRWWFERATRREKRQARKRERQARKASRR